MTRTLHYAAALALAAATLAGCSSDTEPAAAPTTAASSAAATSAAPKNDVECVNIDRAYNAWDSPRRPTTADDFAELNLGSFGMTKEAGEDFLKAVTGYEDQPSKVLATAIASYNVEMALANIEITIDGKMDAAQAKTLETAAAKVESDYQAWKTATCS